MSVNIRESGSLVNVERKIPKTFAQFDTNEFTLDPSNKKLSLNSSITAKLSNLTMITAIDYTSTKTCSEMLDTILDATHFPNDNDVRTIMVQGTDGLFLCNATRLSGDWIDGSGIALPNGISTNSIISFQRYYSVSASTTTNFKDIDSITNELPRWEQEKTVSGVGEQTVIFTVDTSRAYELWFNTPYGSQCSIVSSTLSGTTLTYVVNIPSNEAGTKVRLRSSI